MSESLDTELEVPLQYFVLPTPASPFPTAPLAPPQRALTPLSTKDVIPLTAIAGSKRQASSRYEPAYRIHLAFLGLSLISLCTNRCAKLHSIPLYHTIYPVVFIHTLWGAEVRRKKSWI